MNEENRPPEEGFPLPPQTDAPTPPAGFPQTDAPTPPQIPPREEKPPVRFSVKDWLFLPVSLLLAWLCMSAYSVGGFAEFGTAGLGVAVFVAALLAAVFLRLGKSVRVTPFALLCTACTFLLALSCYTGGGLLLYFLNAFAALGAGVLAVFSLSGQLRSAEATAKQFFEAIGLLFAAIFRFFAVPFRALGTLMKGSRKRLLGVLIGLLCAVPLLALVLVLLMSADAVFSGIFQNIGDWLEKIGLVRSLWFVLRLLVVTLLFFSGLYFLTQPRSAPVPPLFPPDETAQTSHSAAPFVTVLVLLDVIYAVFAAVQIVFLFGGAETAAMKGGYAEYARSGFFQLVAVAAINVAAVLLTCLWSKRCEARGQRTLRVLSLVLLALTLVILASAVYRMALYISVYSLSMLRLLTLWAMLVILVSLLAAARKAVRPEFCFFRVLLVVTLCTWTLLSLANPRRIVAEYNVSAYLSGQVQRFDLEYFDYEFYSMGDDGGDVLPALERLRDSGKYPDRKALDEMIDLFEPGTAPSPWVYRHLFSAPVSKEAEAPASRRE